MLTGRFEAIPGEGEQVTPTTWKSMTDSFKSNYMSGFSILPQETENRSALHKSIESLESVANAGEQGWGQWSANKVAGFAGAVLNPVSLAAGEGAGLLAGKALGEVGILAGRHLSVSTAAVATGIGQKTLGSVVTTLPKWIGEQTVGSVSKGAIKTFAIGTGFSLPEEMANTYNPKDDSFNWWGGIKAASEDGGIGLGLMAVPYLAGSVWGKIFNRATEIVNHADMPMPKAGAVSEGIEPTHSAITKINEAKKAGRISSEHAEFFEDYLTGKSSNADLTTKAVELLIKDGQPVDAAAKRVLFDMFKPEDIDNLHIAIADELASTVPEHLKNALSDFMLRGKLDEYKAKSGMADGIDGVVQFIRNRLQRSPEESIDTKKILRKFLPEKFKEKNPFSQVKIYHAEKTSKRIGATVPKQVARRLSQERKIKYLEDKIKNYEKNLAATARTKFKSKILNTKAQLEIVKNNLEPLLSHADEMKHLREKLLVDGKVKPNFKLSTEYNRLLDLTRVRNDARRLVHEININHEREMHEHYANVLETITSHMRSSVGKLADNETVLNYMKERIMEEVPDSALPEARKASGVRLEEVSSEKKSLDQMRDAEDENTAQKKLIDVYENEMQDAPKELKAEFDEMANKLKEFSASKGVFNNLIKCVMGTLNG